MRVLPLVLMASAASLFAASPVSAEALKSALAKAYQTNPELLAQRAELRATDENLASAQSGYRPSIEASGTYGRSESDTNFGPRVQTDPMTGQVSVTQPLFRGGRTLNSVRQARAQIRAGRANLATVEQTILLQAVAAYFDVVRDQAVVELRRNNVAVLQRQFEATQTRFEVGEITRTDVAQAEARRALAVSNLTAAEAQLTASRAAYQSIIGDPPADLEAEPALPVTPPTEDDALALALTQNPSLIAAREIEQASAHGVDVAVGALLPTIAVTGQAQIGRDVGTPGIETEGWSIVGQISVPLYQGGAEYASIRRQKQLNSADRLTIAQIERQVRENVRVAWENLRSARASIESSRQAVRAQEIAFEGVQQEAQVGARTTLDVLDAEQELLDTRVALVTAQRNEYVAAHQLLAAVGNLNAVYLELGVPIYDPAVYTDEVDGKWLGFGE